MPRNMEIVEKGRNKKPPLPKGRGTTEGGGGIQKRDFVNKKSPSLLRRQPPLGKGAFESFASKPYASQLIKRLLNNVEWERWKVKKS